jgi:hypothetical protein
MLDDLQLFFGEANEAEARVYALLSRADYPRGTGLTGELKGPICLYAKTIPAKFRFTDRSDDRSLLAEAIVPDPSFWTPQLPMLYGAIMEVQLPDGTKLRDRESRLLGLRRLGTIGKSIYLDQQRFVFRGISLPGMDPSDHAIARDTATAICVQSATQSTCGSASQHGVLLIADGTNWSPGDTEQIRRQVATIARWPAVAIIILDDHIEFGNELRRLARNTLFAQSCTDAKSFVRCPWAQVVCWQIGLDDNNLEPPATDLPIIVCYRGQTHATILDGRASCDRIQAQLADVGDFAGYFVRGAE